MKGMTFKTFPYKWTCLIGMAFLDACFWIVVSEGWIGFLFALILALCFLASGAVSLFKALLEASAINFYRLLINVLIVILFIPVGRFGVFVRDQIFLMELPRYQEITNLMVKDEGAKSAVFGTRVDLPPDYSDLPGTVWIGRDARNVVTAIYFSDGSWAIHHDGFLFRSDDDLIALKNSFPRWGFRRLAQNWYHFSG